jgi:hypothetical protein
MSYLHERTHYVPGDMATVQHYITNNSTCETLPDDLKIGSQVVRFTRKYLKKTGGDTTRLNEFSRFLRQTRRDVKKRCR